MKQKIIQSLYYYYWLIRTWPLRKDFPKYKIMSIGETIDEIVLHKKSISRFGDGEFRLVIKERDIVFQKLNESISNRLYEVLNSEAENHIVAFPESFSSTRKMRRDHVVHWLNFINLYGQKISEFVLNKNKVYGNAFISRFYLDYKHKEHVAKLVISLKEIWENKDILFVEGELSRLGIGNDLFDNAKSIERIICPAENAFEKYDEILNKSLEFGKNKLVIIALGPTATVLAYDLSQNGIWALDLGHIDIEYSWFKMKATSRIEISGKKTAELSTQTDFDLNPVLKEEYVSSIISKIL